MGPAAGTLAAGLRGLGIPAEDLPEPDRETVHIGRRYTSGKECVPMTITIGSLLQRLERERDPQRKLCFFMPKSHGPCRFGSYNVLHKIILDRLQLGDRVRVWSQDDAGYFDDIPGGFSVMQMGAFMAEDLMLEALYHCRPAEHRPGAARAVYENHRRDLHQLVQRRAEGDLSLSRAMLEVASKRLFGVNDLIRRAMRDFSSISDPLDLPRVLVVGEIYVRCDPFANDFIIDKLERRGIRCTFAPFNEWLEYVSWINLHSGAKKGLAARVEDALLRQIQSICHQTAAGIMGWPARTTVPDSVQAASDYLRCDLHGEAVLTIGGPVHEWREEMIDGVVSVGPLECMPNKISEAQLFHVAEQEGLPSLTLSLNGDPVDPEVVDNFAFEVRAQHRRGGRDKAAERPRRATEPLRPGVREAPWPGPPEVLEPGHDQPAASPLELIRRGLGNAQRRLPGARGAGDKPTM
jgi:predicted nucleotide-binding protein (sugar kinase/HSP70/actin superfamily)